MFDIRSNENPVSVFAITCEDEKKSNYASSIAYHPTQKHIVNMFILCIEFRNKFSKILILGAGW